MVTIQANRGAFADLPTLAAGEFYWCTDTDQLFIGDPSGNEEIGTAGGGGALATGGTGSDLSATGPGIVAQESVGANLTVVGLSNLVLSGSVLGIATGGVANTHIRNSGACSVIGRSANSTGQVADISAANNGEFLRRAANTVGFGAIAASDLPALNGFTDESSVAADDRIPFYDTGASANRDCAVSDLMLRALPVGACIDWPASTVPTGFLERDGSAVSRSTYATLFSLIGTTWGAGDGSTTFNLPDDRGRTSIGAGTGSGLTARTLAGTGGSESVTLTTGQIPAHSHNQASTEASYNYTGSGTDSHNWSVSGGGNAQAKLGFTTATDGGTGGSHTNMQPWIAYKKIIKALAAT